jgi:glycosyltransferase involved in cell wall biosynthesis
MEESITILVPVFNEEACIDSLYEELANFLNKTTVPAFVLFVNDGSMDRSAELIERVCRMDRRFSAISLERNGGLSTALKAGIDQCKTGFIGYIDADLQTNPADFLKLMPFMYEFELVTGYRCNRKDTLVKRLSSRIANSFRQWLLDDNIIDICCPLKIIRADMAKQMPFFRGMHRFIPDIITLLGGRVKQVPVQHYPRFAGEAKYNLLNRMLGPLIDAFIFRWMQRNAIGYRIISKIRYAITERQLAE